MKLKPRVLARADHPRSRLLSLVTVGTVTLAFVGLGIAMTAGPARADPTCQEIAAGSDTTQDVMNQFSVDIAGNLLCSYNAIDPVSGTAGANISYIKGFNATQPATTCTYTRPNGSTQGLVALRESINPATTATPPLATPAPQGCLDIGLSSSAPGTNANTGGALIFIPFALDAVTGAIGPATGGTVQGINGPVTTVATNLTTTNQFTEANLVSLYTDCTTVTVGGVTYNPNTATTGQQQIDLYVPQAGSGTRNFWASTLGFNATTLPTCVHANIVAGADNGQQVEQNNGTAVATDPDGYVPFSIAQWVSQSKHTTGDAIDLDRRYGTVLQEINSISPTNGTGPNESMNSNFPINREVYNVVEGCRITSSAPLPFTGATCSLDQNLVDMLVGPNSSLCQDLLTIVNYGFAPLPVASQPDSCGADGTSLWAYLPPV